ncbi:hypothetical protein [Sphingobium sp. BS19]|uniref:hypothetical protein n=1 Tax=Sphingobium sp. BS19 TaxID=3018973 RepID=UPI0022EFCA55|nr:hypothetical protein [Sphingobium sp. BS19]GLJ00005.1 hypothetical protein Sbs19_38220 [Sphingobium sp. BS19]
MSDAVFKVRASPIAVFTMGLNPSMAFGAAHIFATPLQRFLNADYRPTVSVAYLALINWFKHQRPPKKWNGQNLNPNVVMDF